MKSTLMALLVGGLLVPVGAYAQSNTDDPNLNNGSTGTLNNGSTGTLNNGSTGTLNNGSTGTYNGTNTYNGNAGINTNANGDANTYAGTNAYNNESYGQPRSSMGVAIDAGLSHYGRGVSDEINNGFGYGAIVDFAPVRNFEVEVNYQGALNTISSRFSTDGRIVTNEIGGDLRFNIVPAKRELAGNLKPYIFGGAAYHRVDSVNFTPGISGNINGFAVPVGLGLESDLGNRFLVGARFTYNFLFNENDGFGGRKPDNWIVGANLGAHFE
jgi:hypothetical protein